VDELIATGDSQPPESRSQLVGDRALRGVSVLRYLGVAATLEKQPHDVDLGRRRMTDEALVGPRNTDHPEVPEDARCVAEGARYQSVLASRLGDLHEQRMNARRPSGDAKVCESAPGVERNRGRRQAEVDRHALLTDTTKNGLHDL